MNNSASRKKINKSVTTRGEKPRRGKNPLLIIAAAVIFVGILVGTVLGVISCVLSANAVMEYEGVRLDKKTASYLASVYKNTYIAALKASGVKDARDDVAFWQSTNPDGVSYGDAFEKSAEQFLREVVVGVYLYDRYSELDKAQKAAIETSASKVAEYYYNTQGYEALFEKDAALMGYDYDSFVKAAEMLYKYRNACSAVYGASGEGAAELVSDCNEFLKNTYTHVEFLFIRTRTTFELDEDGNRKKNPDGTYPMRELTYKEKSDRESDIAELRSLIDSYNRGTSGDEIITPTVINAKAKKYLSDQSVARIEKGYYFSPSSEYTVSFSDDAQLKRALDLALSLDVGKSGEAYSYLTLNLADEDGNREPVECIVYKSPVAEHAYADSDLSSFFTDFYADAAEYIHAKVMGIMTLDVEVKDSFYELDVALIPKNDKHVIRSFT